MSCNVKGVFQRTCLPPLFVLGNMQNEAEKFARNVLKCYCRRSWLEEKFKVKLQETNITLVRSRDKEQRKLNSVWTFDWHCQWFGSIQEENKVASALR